MNLLSVLEGVRKDVHSRIQSLTDEEAMRVPEGFRNSIHWNIGHILHVQLAHWYVRRGLALPVDPGFRKYFSEGKSPSDYDGNVPAFARLLGIYQEYSFDLERKFGNLLSEPLTQPFDYLNSAYATVADDLHLLVFHEGEHYPMIKRLLKALGKT
ncbi:MAG: DinB family protein [Fibrobacteres bacterium]|nr:DinB family protein [Fibrobacterota bacterium]